MKNNHEINQFNLKTGIFSKHKASIYNTLAWHKIEVENAATLSRDTLFRIIMNFVHPLDFIPVQYEINSNGIVSFLLKNCGAAMEKMCKQNLIIPNPHNPNLPFILKISINCVKATDLKIFIQPNIKAILNKRFTFSTGLLDLDNFSQEPDLLEFCTLSQPKQMFYLLHLSRSLPIKILKLSNNEIEVLKPLEALCGIKSLTILDLRNNKIPSSDLVHLEGLNITDLFLDGNPLCDEHDEISYQRICKQVCPSLEKLDGYNLNKNGLLNFRRNYVCTPAGQNLVDQFLEHYFTLYDTRDRSVLAAIYHKDAMFSLTATYLSLQSTSLGAKLANYKKISRNIKMMSDFSKNYETLYRGPASIIGALVSLPQTEHDPYSFTVDLMSYTEKTAVLTVTGVYREISENPLESDRLLGFSRIFVLMAGPNMEYTIINEQMNVSNATTMMAMRAFKVPRGPQLPRQILIPKPQGAKDQLDMAEAVKAMTGLNMEWSTKFLEECNFHLAKTLSLFVDVFKLDKLPEDAFREPDHPMVTRQPEAPIVSPIVQIPSQDFALQNKIPVTTRNFEGPVLVSNVINNTNRAFKTDSSRKRVLDVRNAKQIESRPTSVQYDPYTLDSEQGSNSKSAIEIIDSDDEDNPTRNIQHMQPLLPLEPSFRTSPYGIFEDYEPFTYNNLFNPAKMKNGLKPATADIWKAVDSLSTLRQDFEILKKMRRAPKKVWHINSLDTAMDILRKYSYHIVTYQLLLLWYYPSHQPAGKQLAKNMQEYVQENPHKCISRRVLDVLLAECECRYGGDHLAGENMFKRLTVSDPEFIPPYMGYTRYLVSKGRVDDARSFIAEALAHPAVDKMKLTRLIQNYEELLNCNILT